MMNDAPKVAAHSRRGAGPKLPRTDAARAVNASGREAFATVNPIVHLRKHVGAQAISRALARRSGVWHLDGTGATVADRAHAATRDDALSKDTAFFHTVTAAERAGSRHIAAEFGGAARPLRSGDLVNTPDATPHRVVAHTARAGLSPARPARRPPFEKAVPEALTARIKAGLRGCLRREGLSDLPPMPGLVGDRAHF
ncbi:MAG: hypothetical protein AAF281_06650 [Pseudomonadota bacterium]